MVTVRALARAPEMRTGRVLRVIPSLTSAANTAPLLPACAGAAFLRSLSYVSVSVAPLTVELCSTGAALVPGPTRIETVSELCSATVPCLCPALAV